VSADPRSSIDAQQVFARLAAMMAERKGADPASSYVAKLFAKAPDGALKKVGEEATEFIMACKDAEQTPDAKDKIVSEAADVWFHMLVAMARHDLGGTDVLAELARREGLSGLDEKAARPK